MEDLTRRTNRSKVLRYLFVNGDTPRYILSQEVGLTQGSISRIVNECVQARLIVIRDTGDTSGNVGRRPIPMGLNDVEYFVAAVHIGVNWLDVGIVNLKGEVVEFWRHDRLTTVPTEIVETITTDVQAFSSERPVRLLAMCVSLNAVVDDQSGVVVRHDVLGWNNVELSSLLEDRLNTRVIIENDIHSMAMSEYFREPLEGTEPLLLVSIGTTIGMGMVANHNLVKGRQGQSGVLEHAPWQGKGPLCECGIEGCMTVVLSDRTLVSRLQELDLASPLANISDAVRAAHTETAVRELIDIRAAKVGELLTMLSAIYDPGRLVLHGTGFDERQFAIVKEHYRKGLPRTQENRVDPTWPLPHGDVPFPLYSAGIMALQLVFSPALSLEGLDSRDRFTVHVSMGTENREN